MLASNLAMNGTVLTIFQLETQTIVFKIFKTYRKSAKTIQQNWILLLPC